jgi:hypothetical protein
MTTYIITIELYNGQTVELEHQAADAQDALNQGLRRVATKAGAKRGVKSIQVQEKPEAD